MSSHTAKLAWRRRTPGFGYEEYDRRHSWSFDSGIELKASASPEFRGSPDCVDPEEALVAALASCHMLTFLAIASRKRLVVDAYEDEAVGWLEKNAEGKLAVTRVSLRPKIKFAGEPPAPEELAKLHELSHQQCFLANSVRTAITIDAPL